MADAEKEVSVERDEHDELESRGRVKRKTEKGQVLYEETVKKYLNKCDTIWSDIEDMAVKLDEYKTQLDFKSLRTLDKELQELKTKHAHESEDFLAFLDRTNTEDSISELRVQEVLQIKCRDIMKELSRSIREARIEATERLSQRGSSRSGLLTRSEVGEPSTNGSFLAKKKMEVEAQRARLQYEARELMLRKQKASLEEKEAKHKAEQTRQREELDAEFLLLEQERKFAIAEAEVRALEETEMGSRHVSPEPSLLQEPVDRSQLTAKYVYESCTEDEETSVKRPEIRDIRPLPVYQDTHKSSLNPNAAPFEVKQTGGDNVVRDLTKFLLKKELPFEYNDIA